MRERPVAAADARFVRRAARASQTPWPPRWARDWEVRPLLAALYWMGEFRPGPDMPWAAHAAFWVVLVVALGIALAAAAALVLGWGNFSGKERLQLVALALFL